MGIYDREYYRDETAGSGWFSGVAPATRTLILINVAAFLARWIFPDLAIWEELEASSPAIFERFHLWQLVTATFLHAGPIHLLFNLLILWWAGQEVESIYGRRDFLAMYLTAAAFSTLCWALLSYFGPTQGRGVMLGASGAVLAVLMIYTMYYPRREVLLFFVLPMQLRVLMTITLLIEGLFVLQELGGRPSGAGVAYAAHVGGALYGFLFKRYDLRFGRLLAGRVRRPRLRLVDPERYDRDVDRSRAASGRAASATPSARTGAGVAVAEEQLEARLDEVLAKIAREGRSGLTDEENRILEEASRRARNRRSDRP